jgi:hypothetical protein
VAVEGRAHSSQHRAFSIPTWPHISGFKTAFRSACHALIRACMDAAGEGRFLLRIRDPVEDIGAATKLFDRQDGEGVEKRLLLRRAEMAGSRGFAADSPLEERGFEPLVPLATEMLKLATGMLEVGDIGPVPRLC